MGMFSWITSDTHKSIAAGMDGYRECPQKVFLLNPFGNPYVEEDYDGYGHFGGQDVYALVAKWNKPELCKDKNGEWLPDSRIRGIGIRLACYDENHVRLRYPIKIVEEFVPYEEADISPNCPFQGCSYEDYEDVYDEDNPEIYDAICELKEEEGLLLDAEDELMIDKNHYFIWGFYKGVNESTKYYNFNIENMKDTSISYVITMIQKNDEEPLFFIEPFDEDDENSESQNPLEYVVTDPEEVKTIKTKLINFASWH